MVISIAMLADTDYFGYSVEFLSPSDTIPKKGNASDRVGDPFSNKTKSSPLIIDNSDNINTSVELDSSGEHFNIKETVGNELDYRPESYMTFEEYKKYQERQMMKNYWRTKDSTNSKKQDDDKAGPMSLKIPVPGLAGPFGSDYVDIRPSGLVTLNFAYKRQHTFNPQLQLRQQRQGTFDFDNQIQLNVVGKIGEKLKLSINWDTKATFEFQNNFKIEYTGFEEDILQGVEVGQVSMPINSTLISGAQNLFGVKTKMQFGRMTATSVFATQRGKSDEIRAQGGATQRTFEIKADNYDEYRHFFLGHFFRDNYEKSLQTTPVVTSNTKLYPSRIEVYVTNTNNTTQDLRNIVAYLDLGENQSRVYNQSLNPKPAGAAIDNEANNLYSQVEGFRNPISLPDNLSSIGLQRGTDYEIINNARKLKPEEFTFHPDLGYISLLSPIKSYEVLAVAYQYTYDGKEYKVGELSEENINRDSTQAIILKMIKPSSIKTRLPSWDLMMKNIYSLGSSQLSQENFQFRIIYKDDISGADLPNLQEGEKTKNVPILRLLGLDRLNPQGDPYPDGNFDFIEGVTIDSRLGRVIFPVLEPFGSNLARQFNQTTETDLINKYEYFELYDSTKSDAFQVSSKNKFVMKGRYQSSSSNVIYLQGAMNLAPGSVKVFAGSQQLQEGSDYTVDYNLGRVTILNEGVLTSGQEIRVNYEKQDLFNVRQKSLIGTRLDYKINKDVYFGGTFLHQNERPTLTRVNIGDEPSSNTVWGIDGNITKESRFLTKAIDKLPLIQTKVPSSVTAQAEFAQFLPGHNKALDNNGDGGAAFVDDFEASETPYDFVRSPSKWKLASTPARFTESSNTDLSYGYNRALLSWYNIDNQFYTNGQNRPTHLPDPIINHYERAIAPTEIFPNYNVQQVQANQITLDLAYYPNELGPYNFTPFVNADGTLQNPTQKWGGIQREIRNDIDFDNANIQYIEFWMMSPWVEGAVENTEIAGLPFDKSNKGKLYFNLGNVSEDVLKDERLAFENGLPVQEDANSKVDLTNWGRVSKQQPLTNAFDNNPGARDYQDVGLDGLNSEEEASYFSSLGGTINNTVDPANDDFKYFLGDEYDQQESDILTRYKYFSGMEGNSPDNGTQASYFTPDSEDLNQDNTVNSIEEYYEYEIDIDTSAFEVGKNFIVGKQVVNSSGDEVTWYQFRVPVRTPTAQVGNISGFKSIRFMRMYMTGFESPVVLRFAQLQLVANQWRVYQKDDLGQNGLASVVEPDDATMIVSTVNIEENGGNKNDGFASPYVLPPGTIRDQDPTSTIQRQNNEQSLRLTVYDLDDKNARAVFKNVSYDMLNYKMFNMYIHAEKTDDNITDGQMNAFVRLGTDNNENYYEIEVPLYFTVPNAISAEEIWRAENEIKIEIEEIINTKVERNNASGSKRVPYSRIYNGKKITVMGNPDISAIQSIMIGMRNPYENLLNPNDADHSPKSATIWVNEMRMTQFVQKSSWAAAAKMNAKLADLATVTSSVRYSTAGFGGLEQKVSERDRNNKLEYGAATNVTVDKFIPEKMGLKVPMYLSYNKKVVDPTYNPLDPDVEMKKYDKDTLKQIRKLVQDVTTQRAINFTNFKKVKVKKDAKQHFYDIENLSFTVGYNETKRTSFDIKEYLFQYYKGGIEYNFSPKSKAIEPFKKSKLFKPKSLKLVRDFNFTPLPSSFTFRNDIDRRITRTEYYESGPTTPGQAPIYEKSFMLTRTYGTSWNLAKSLSLNYDAKALAVVDEPGRAPGDEAYKDTLWNNFWNFGRLKTFNQNANANYKVPINKLPGLDWVNSDVKYNTGYVWTSGALGIRDTMGNLIQNNRKIDINARLNLNTLYNKSKFLKDINNPRPPVKKRPSNPKDTTEEKKREYKALKAAMRSLMMLESVNASYSWDNSTQIAGYMPIPSYFGVDNDLINSSGDLLPFVFGSQDPNQRLRYAEKGWISKERELNTPFLQTNSRTLNVRANVEPFKDFKVNVNFKKSKGSDYQELFRADSAETYKNTGENVYLSDNPSRNGSYSISTITALTAFKPTTGLDNFNETFATFQSNRFVIRDRFNDDRYGANSQDVLIPSFLAAYTANPASKQKLTNYPKIPLPNWTISYAGLNKVKFIQKKVSSIALNHGYSSQYSIGSFASSLIYTDNFIRPDLDFDRALYGDSINVTDSLIIPIYILDQVTIRETFSPIIGINIRTKGRWSYRIDYKKTRNLSMSLSNAQIREDLSTDLVVGVGFAKKGVKLPKFQGRSVVLKNELSFRMDMTLRDTRSYQRKIDDVSTVTAGIKNLQVKPSLTYVVNQRLTAMAYFEHTRAYPKLSSSFKRYTSAFGIQIRFTLS